MRLIEFLGYEAQGLTNFIIWLVIPVTLTNVKMIKSGLTNGYPIQASSTWKFVQNKDYQRTNEFKKYI